MTVRKINWPTMLTWRFLWSRQLARLRVEKLYAEYLLPVCSPLLLTGDKPLKTPEDLAKHTLLHDASRRDWQAYTRQLGLNHINVQQGPIFSHSAMVLQAAIHGQGVALANNVMSQSEIEAGRLVCPFNDVLVSKTRFIWFVMTVRLNWVK